MMPKIAMGTEISNRTQLLRELDAAKTKYYVNTKVKAITVRGVECEQNEDALEIAADVIVLAVGQQPYGRDLTQEIYNRGYEISVVGNDTVPTDFETATKGGYLAASIL